MKGREPAVRVEKVGAAENVFAPAMVWAPVVTRPLADAPASGILKVWVVLADEILKSVPLVPVAKVCVLAVNPFRLVMSAPVAVKVDMGSLRTSPLVIVRRLSALVLVPSCTPVSVKGLVATTCKAVEGEVVPMPTFPLALMRILSVLLVINGRSKLSTLPNFFITPLLLPDMDQKSVKEAVGAKDCQYPFARNNNCLEGIK